MITDWTVRGRIEHWKSGICVCVDPMVVYTTFMGNRDAQFREMLRGMPCMGATLRMATRAVTRYYNSQLRAAGIEGTQFTMLRLLEWMGPMTQTRLGEIMAAEKTTMSRNLKLLEKKKWIEADSGEDRRKRIVRITELGRKQVAKAKPFWDRAQARMKEGMTPAKFAALRELLWDATEAALGE
jgi:DNA-binding MarR family transcriptional regulator